MSVHDWYVMFWVLVFFIIFWFVGRYYVQKWKKEDKAEWRLEVLDDFGIWGNVDWSALIAKAHVEHKMVIHAMDYKDKDGMHLERLTHIINVLTQKGVSRSAYGNRNLRIHNTRTNESIPVEALGINE